MPATVLVLPGYGDSGPDHWQTRWRSRLPTASLVEQADWDRPDLPGWVGAIVTASRQAQRPIVFIAHSLGVTTLAHAAAHLPPGVARGAFLVAPPADQALLAVGAAAFTPTPAARLPFPSLLVASANDPYGPHSEAETKASHWGSRLVSAGEAGHINAESGHGPWPEGLMQFAGFIKSL